MKNHKSYKVYGNSEKKHETVYEGEFWFILFGKSKTIHRVQFRRFDGELVFIKESGKNGVTPYLHESITLVQKCY